MRDYLAPLVLALALHGGVAYALARSWDQPPQAPRVLQPQPISARLLVIEKPAAPVSAPPKPSPPPPPPPKRPKPAAKPAPKPQAPPQPKPDPEAAEREARLRELAERSTLAALDAEAAAIERSAQEQAAMTYMHAIHQAIRREWNRPPSARNGMEARLRIMLAPTGELLAVTVIDSSGNAAFDRSAEQAVRKVRKFPVPQDRTLFEAQFRRFTTLFRPEDLLR